MAENPRTDGGGRHDDTEGLADAAIGLIAEVERQFDAWVTAMPGLDSAQAQIIIFSRVARRLALAGLPMGGLIQQTARAYGVEIESLEIADAAGDMLVQITHTRRPPDTTH